MTASKAIELVKKDLSECDISIDDGNPIYITRQNNNGDWEIICKFKSPSEEPIEYLVRKDGTVLIVPTK